MTTRFSLIDQIQNIEHVPAYLTDAKGHITLWNDNASCLLGFGSNEVLGFSETRLYVDPLEFSNIGGSRFSWRKTKYNGSIFVHETAAEIKDADSDSFRFLKVVEDYSTDLTLTEKCDLWVTQYQNMGQAVLACDARSWNLTNVSKQCATFWGYDTEEIIGQSVNKVLCSEAAANRVEVGKEVTSNPGRLNRLVYVNKSGKLVYAMGNVLLIEDPSGDSCFLARLRPMTQEQIQQSDQLA